MAQPTTLESPALAQPAYDKSKYLFSPLIDFLGLGGGSLIAFVFISLFFRSDAFYPAAAVSALWLTNVINHPHFAHSYQIFYRNFPQKLSGDAYPANLRARYWFSGVIAPVVLAVFLAGAFLAGRPDMLALAALLMFFLVGWHYVKQGYGMAMVDAVLKKRFFNEREKQALLINAYATWLFAWIFINRTIAERKFLGLDIPVFPIPDALFFLSAAAAIATLGWLCFVLFCGLARGDKQYPINGLIAYVTSLYPWLFFREVNPIYFAFVPAFHSLQYLTVVWRYELNANGASPESASKKPIWRLIKFYMLGAGLGAAGFWAAPLLLTDMVAYDTALLGASAFMFVFWTFINVHHYLMDNVMWRKGNPDVAKHLFGAKPKPAA